MIVIELAGAPQGKGRPRFIRKTGHAYTPAKTRNYESNLRLAAQDVMHGSNPLEGPLAVTVHALFPVPASWSQKKRKAALEGALRPTGKPDFDNLAKVLDGLNEVVFRDDKQIVDGRVIKTYSARPALRIEVQEVKPDDEDGRSDTGTAHTDSQRVGSRRGEEEAEAGQAGAG